MVIYHLVLIPHHYSLTFLTDLKSREASILEGSGAYPLRTLLQSYVDKAGVSKLIHLVTECTLKSQLIMQELLLDDDEMAEDQYIIAGRGNDGGAEEERMNEE